MTPRPLLPVRHRLLAAHIIGCSAVWCTTALADDEPSSPGVRAAEVALETVEVQGSAAALRRFDAAASHTSVEVDGFTEASPLVNLSELLAGQAGLAALDRQNYAQDLQIAVRGFGARSTFGVRGVRILVDGIPATMPDGQGQAATAHLQSASRIDVLRGPLAQLHGNAAGGVIQVATREPRQGRALQASVAAGSHGQRMLGAAVDAGSEDVSGLLEVSRYETDGWREHSAAQRTHVNGKLVVRPDGDTRVTTLVNLFDQPLAQDPLGLTRAQWEANPRQAVPVATQFDPRKSVEQRQLGIVLDRRQSSSTSLRLRAYGGTRAMRQYLAFSGDAASSSGGVVDLDRHYYGMGASWTREWRTTSGLPVTMTLGVDADRLSEQRQGFVNNGGVSGGLRRNERDRAGNTDLYGQVDALLAPTWRIVAGLRSTQVRSAVADRFVTPANPDDSGSRSWRHTSPALGVVWSAADHLNLYANVGQGFETPTLSEMAYSPGNVGPNYGLQAATSVHAELGAKWQGEVHRWEAAWFTASTRDEIVPASTVGGRTIFQNADRVRRRGLEGTWSADLGKFTPRVSYSYLDAHFATGYATSNGTRVAPGARLPGTTRHAAHASVHYVPAYGWKLGASLSLSGKVYANDLNTESAPGYGVVGLSGTYAFSAAGARWQAWMRLDNLFNKQYAGSLIVNDGNGRFYEPGAGRRVMLGLRAQFL